MALIDVIDVGVELKCSKCGADLSGSGHKTKYGGPVIDVEPCEDCLEKERGE